MRRGVLAFRGEQMWRKLYLMIVGTGVLAVPFARRSLTKSLLQWEKVPRNEADEVSLA